MECTRRARGSVKAASWASRDQRQVAGYYGSLEVAHPDLFDLDADLCNLLLVLPIKFPAPAP